MKVFTALVACMVITVITPIGSSVLAILSLILLVLLALGIWITADVKTDPPTTEAKPEAKQE